MVTPPTRTVKPAPPATRTPAPVGNKKPAAVAKIFKTATWETAEEGKRIILYGDSGMGKTTLAAMLPNPKFADFRGGSDKIKHPVTGEKLTHIPGVETFEDVRTICHQPGLLMPGDTLVVDTGTEFEDRGLEWTLANIPHEKGKSVPIHRIEDYGWGKGYRNLYDTMKLPLSDFDTLIHRGVSVAINCQMMQIEIAHAGGEDFLCDVPKLQHQHGKTTPAVWALYCEWADHVLKIGYNDVQTEDGKAAGGSERAVFVHGKVYFKAKSRTIPNRFPIVSFSHPGDDSIWEFLFNEAWKGLEE